MASRKTIPIRAPKDLVSNLRVKFPGVSDADMFRVMYNTSLIRLESNLRKDVKKKLR